MWGWPSSRHLEDKPVAGRGGSNSSNICSNSSPGRASLERRSGGAVPAAAAAAAAVAASPPAPKEVTAAFAPVSTSSPASATSTLACLRRRRSFQAAGATATSNLASPRSSSPDLPAISGEKNTPNTVAAAATNSLLADVGASLDDDDDDDDGDSDGGKKKKANNSLECVVASALARKNNADNSNNSGGDEVLEPASPTNSIASVASEGGGALGWAEWAGLCGGVAMITTSRKTAAAGRMCGRAGVVRKRSPLGNKYRSADGGDNDDDDDSSSPVVVAVKNRGSREVPRFLRPVMVLMAFSLLAIGVARFFRARRIEEGWGRGVVLLGPAAYAAGSVQLSEAVVDDHFERADKDNDGVIRDKEIQCLVVDCAGGAVLNNATEIEATKTSVIKDLDRDADHVLSRSDLNTYWDIEAATKSVIKNLDLDADHVLSRSDLNTYWDRLGTLMTVDEAAEWVLHAAQLPQEVADAFVNNEVTGYDFPALAAREGALLEQDLGVTRPAFKRRLVRSMKWKLWGMGEEPAAPTGLRAANSSSCGAVSLDWDPTTLANSRLNFPVHKYVVRRAALGQQGERDEDWVVVMASPNSVFFDAGLRAGAAYRYALQAWNALGHSTSVEIDVVVATENCALGSSWFWWPGGGGGAGRAYMPEASFGGLMLATVVSVAAAFCFRAFGAAQARVSNFPKGSGVTDGSIPTVVAEEEFNLPEDAPLQKVTLAKSLGPKPLVYVSTSHGVELAVQAGSLLEEVHLPVTVSPRLQFVECRTDVSARAPFHAGGFKEEFLAMTFVHGPEQASFLNDKPAKLRFFVGYVDEFAPGDGSDRVVDDRDIEEFLLNTYRPVTSPNGVDGWAVLNPFSVLFPPPVRGDREVWVEVALCHFCTVAFARRVATKSMQVQGADKQSYLYEDVGRSMWRRPKRRPCVPTVFFGNDTERDAVFTYYPIVTFTEASRARGRNAQVDAAGMMAIGVGTQDQSSVVGGDRPAADEGILVVLEPGEYISADLSCGVKEHPQMHVRIGVLMDKTGEGMEVRGKLQLLDVRKIAGNKILVLRPRRLRKPVAFGTVEWPCDAKDIIQLGKPAGPREPAAGVTPQEPASAVIRGKHVAASAPQGLPYGRTDSFFRPNNGGLELLARLWVPLLFAIFAIAVYSIGTGSVMPSCPAFFDPVCSVAS